MKKLVIVCPLFHSSGSGSATYYQLLTAGLSTHNVQVTVISDREKGNFKQYYGLFPKRCAQDKHFFKDIWAYGIQNLFYFRISAIICRVRPDALLVHSSFYNFTGLFDFSMKRIRKNFSGRIVADVRDQLMPPERIPLLNDYDAIVACSLNTKAYLEKNNADKKKIIHIPVLQEPLNIDKYITQKVLQKYGLKEKNYIFYAGLLKEAKGVNLLLRSYCDYLQNSGMKLVLAGFNKLANNESINLLSHPRVIYIGNQERNTILALMHKAALCVNLSFSEGLPRASLEAIALGCQVALPKGIPEFDKYCPEFVIQEKEPEPVATRVREILSTQSRPNYPIEEHYPRKILKKYLQALFN